MIDPVLFQMLKTIQYFQVRCILRCVYLELTEMVELRTVDPSAVPEVCAC